MYLLPYVRGCGIKMNNKKTLKYDSTHIKIIEAYKKLVSQRKSLNNITVKEISEAAGINRKSFYLHFDNIEELQKYCQEVMVYSIIEKLLKETDLAEAIRSGVISKYINKFLEENYDFYMRIISEVPCCNLYAKGNEFINNKYKGNVPCINGYTMKETIQTILFLIYASLSIYRFNYQNNIGYTPKQLSDFIFRNGKLIFRLKS